MGDIGGFTVNNRRFLGSKHALIPFIRGVVDQCCEGVGVVADVFAGTGCVANGFTDKKLVVNDILYHNHLAHIAFFSGEPYNETLVENLIDYYNSVTPVDDNYMSDTYADTFFSHANSVKIGFIRDDIEGRYHSGEIGGQERALLVTSLVYAADRVARTCGHYDAYRKNVNRDVPLTLKTLIPSVTINTSRGNECYHEDANVLARKINADLVYLDPPYNSRQYCDMYHVLENVAVWNKPPVTGVTRKTDRSTLKSRYCTRGAVEAFNELITTINARYILLSYNNMGDGGDRRSNSQLSDTNIIDILTVKGETQVFAHHHRAFHTGKGARREHINERLFLCTVQ